MIDLAGQHAVVTGAGTGIGAAIARRLAGAGAAVSLMGRRRDPLDATAAGLDKARSIPVDITDEAAVASAMAAAAEAFGPVSVLVNNAGIAPSSPFSRTSVEDFRAAIEVNVVGAFLCTRSVLPAMLTADWGRVITIASTAGLKGYPYVSAYVASKHGVIGLTRALALEVARTGVTVNAICPAFTDTEIVQRSIATIVEKTGRSAEQALAELVKSNPQGRLIDPDEVAGMALWLCSRDARSVTGQALGISGGEAT